MSSGKTVYRFGPFVVDSAERQLTRDGVVVAVPPKAFDTLLELVRNSGHMLEKRELMTAIWPDSFVEEVNLAQSVSMLRKALGERAGSRQFIETIPKCGYRFVAPVEVISDAAGVTAPRPAEPRAGLEQPNATAPEHHKTWYMAFIAASVLISAVALLLASRTPKAVKHEAAYTQITDFTDSAVAPALSPDGRTVAFIRGADWFLSSDQIWLKSLPDGEPVQLTHDPRPKFAPAFTPDGSRITYSIADFTAYEWNTFAMALFGGEPRLLLRNAEGLTWLSARQVLFSEIKTGMHMGVVTAAADGSGRRSVYFPEHERAMAHFSYASPDRKWVLVIEMDHTAAWQRCRLLPLDGSSAGVAVGPPGQCTAAAWSPDGRWMYFTGRGASGDHVWRQPFGKTEAEQVTFGPTEEQGVAVAPDGRSLITSVGDQQSSVWIHDDRGDRPITSAGNASIPRFSTDGKHLYYVLRRGSAESGNELWMAQVDSGKSERLLAGFSIMSYDISSDSKQAVFATARPGGTSEIWLAAVDGRSAPRRIAQGREDSPFFGPDGQVLLRVSEGRSNYLYRVNRDGSARTKVVPYPISNFMGVSPNGRWAAVTVPANGTGNTVAEIAIPMEGGKPQRLCTGRCTPQWAPDGRYLYISLELARVYSRKIAAIPLPPRKSLPDLPSSGIESFAQLAALAGGRVIEHGGFAPGLNPETFAYVRMTMHRNLFRVPLH
ncbi:MAG TPA: winged helix-turn-helix domain-containing protein [Bryobacteraceae bacterium]|nr:winged helix-turn-helix domain-containing protein [Bryobacteraceae bacterium]